MSRQQSGWEVLDRQPVALDPGAGRYVAIEQWVVRHREGGPTFSYPIVFEPDYVQVLGVARGGELILILEDKIAGGPSIQAAAGIIGEGELPEEAACREYSEETGCAAGRLVSVCQCIPQSHRLASRTKGNDGAKRAHLFCVESLGPSAARPEATEKIVRRIHIPWRVALACVLQSTTVPGTNLQILDAGTHRLILTIPSHPELLSLVSSV